MYPELKARSKCVGQQNQGIAKKHINATNYMSAGC